MTDSSRMDSSFRLPPSSLRPGWQIVRFGEVAKEIKATTSDPVAEGLEFYVGLEHLDPQSLRIQRKGVIAEDNPTFTRLFKSGQILFGKRRAYQKKAAVADFSGICSGDILVMEAKPGKILPGLLPFIVQSDLFFDWAVKTSSGSLSPRTKWKSLAEFEFPLPPPARQKAILEVLEKIQCTHLRVIDAISAAKELSRSFIQEHIQKMQAERVNPISLGHLGVWRGGGTPSMAKKEFWMNGTVPWVSPKDMGAARIRQTEDSITEEAIRCSSTSLIEEGSILFVTRSGILRHTLPIGMLDSPMAINQDIKALTISSEYNRNYIWFMLQFFSSKILKDCSKVGTTVESIDFKQLKEFELLVPGRSQQDNVVKVLLHQSKVVEMLRDRADSILSMQRATFSEFLLAGGDS